MIPYGRQDISEEDIQAVVEVLRSDWLTQGPVIERFERMVAERCGARHAVAVSNATAALHIACLAAGLGSGDRLWTSPNTFLASANCGLYCGATPDFVDIDPRTCNMSAGALEEKLAVAARTGQLPKVIVPVHFAGQSCDMRRIGALAQQHGITVIEDASHAIGGSYAGKPIGNCAFSDMTVFSFHPVKIVTTGEGGMVLTNRDDLAARLRLFRSHGMTRDPAQMRTLSHGPWCYEQVDLGYNYRITDMQAALGCSQMTRLDEFIARRKALAERYDMLLAERAVVRPWQHPDGASAWHLYVIRLQLDRIGKSRRQVFDGLRGRGIGVNVHYIPVHMQPYYRRFGFAQGDFPEAERYYEEAISLPLFYGLTEAMQDEVVAALCKELQ
jgi:UDP-4-amino-4,6-dideoxy-N-acetyl-beta-L-altrosamine transaminase